MTDARLGWIDNSREQPFETTLGPVTFSLSNLHTKSDPDSPYEFEAVTESGELLVWDGTFSWVEAEYLCRVIERVGVGWVSPSAMGLLAKPPRPD